MNSELPPKPPVYFITQGYQHEIVINHAFEIHKPHFNKANDLVFSFLYKNPNKVFTRKQIEEAIGVSIGKSFNIILNELGFKGALRKLFFPNVSKVAIKFKDKVYMEDIYRARIDENKLENQIMSLKIWKDKF